MSFPHSIDEIVDTLGKGKGSLKRFIEKNFKEGVHYINQVFTTKSKGDGRGGYNRVDTRLTADAFKLCLVAYDLKHKNKTTKQNQSTHHQTFVLQFMINQPVR